MSGIIWEESKLHQYTAPDALLSKIKQKPLKVYPKLIWLLDVLVSEKKIKATFKQGLKAEDKERFLDALKTAGLFSAKNVINLKGENSLNCLEEACRNQNESFAIELIKRGMLVKESAWTLAQELGQPNVLKAMVKHAAANRSFKKLRELYDWSCERRSTSLSKALLDYFSEDAEKLLKATIQGDLAEVKNIVASFPADKKMKKLNYILYQTRQTPLELAYAAGHSQIFEFLIKAQADRKLKVSSSGESREFDVNASFFSARSAVFKALFDSSPSKVEFEIQEDDLESFSQMVTFLYSGYLNLKPGNFKHIIAIAGRYEITGVKEKCLKWLSNNPIFIEGKEKLSVLDKIPPFSPECPSKPFEDEPKSEDDYFKKWLTSEEISETDILHACKEGWLEALQYMQRRGTKIDNSKALMECRDEKIILFLIQSIIQSRPVTNSDISYATYAGSLEGVKLLLEKISPNEKIACITDVLSTCSWGCKRAGCKEVILFLLNEGAELDLELPEFSSLDHAVRNGWSEVLALILKKIPQTEKVATLNRARFQGKNHESSLLLNACQTLNICEEVAELLIQEGADVLFANISGETALYHAISQGYFKLAKLIWTKIPANLRNTQLNRPVAVGKMKTTALTEALQSGEEDFVLFLLNAGVEIRLHDAVKAGFLEVAKQILRRIPPAEKQQFLDQKYGENQITALCAAFPDPHEIKALLKCKTYRQLAQFLIEEGASVSIAGVDGSTPLFYASRTGFTDSVKQILSRIPPSEKLAYVNQKGGPHQTTAFLESLASPLGMEDLPKLLLEEGADPTLIGNNGMNLLHGFAVLDSVDFAQQLFAKIPAASRAAFIHASCGAKMMNPLTAALEMGNRPLALFLIQNGAKMSLSSLARAITGGFVDLIRPIWEAMPPERQESEGDLAPPLLIALVYRQLACAKELMEIGVDVTEATEEGLNALHLAILDNLEGVVEEILKRVPENKRKEFVNQTVSFRNLSCYFTTQRHVDELQGLIKTIPDEIEFTKLKKIRQRECMQLSPWTTRKTLTLISHELNPDEAITPLELTGEIYEQNSKAINRMLEEAGADAPSLESIFEKALTSFKK